MRLPVLCLLVLLLMTSANAYGQTQPSGHLDPSSHSSGLSLVLFEREAFNTFLGQIPPKCRRENGLGEELMTKIMELDAARHLLERGRALVPDSFSPLPKDMDEELRHRKERMWAALPEEKLIRSFRVLGYLGANEDLTDFLRRSPERKKYLVAEVPAFAVAQLKLEAYAKK